MLFTATSFWRMPILAPPPSTIVRSFVRSFVRLDRAIQASLSTLVVTTSSCGPTGGGRPPDSVVDTLIVALCWR